MIKQKSISSYFTEKDWLKNRARDLIGSGVDVVTVGVGYTHDQCEDMKDMPGIGAIYRCVYSICYVIFYKVVLPSPFSR